MNYPDTDKPLTVENIIEIISRLHFPYSGFLYNIEQTKLDGIAKLIKDDLWENNPNELYVVTRIKLEIIVGIIHLILGGQDWRKNIDETHQSFEKALTQLNKSGKAQQISKNEWSAFSGSDFLEDIPRQRISEEKWEIPPLCQRIFGEGKGGVYLYYFDKEKAEAQDQGNKVWSCNIGFTERQPKKRIQEQMAEDSDIPIIALLLRTDKPKLLEKTIHGILKLRGLHLKQAQGNEWFLTYPDEIVSIYRFITDSEYQITV